MITLERCSYRFADHVIVTNESSRKISRQRGSISESKVTVVRNGPIVRDPSLIGTDASLLKKASNIVAFAGVTGTQDGLDHLCRALQYLLSILECDDLYCIVIGDGDALQRAKQMAADLGLAGKIWFAGWISDRDVYAKYMHTADICVSPEPFNDYNDRSTFMKIMEYMAMGKPIVAYDLCETRRSAQSSAHYANPGDVQGFARAISLLINNPAIRKSMGDAGLLRVQHELAWQYSVPTLLKAYSQIVVPGKTMAQTGD